ncbi:PAS domain S-box protein [Methylomonas sp. AM2-LC]|uniref:PAS domain S-box protein n=1 Tax=Methylomonas sp. AM2-LC TaxID=3153301 RepID=UPI003267E0BE
MNKHSEIISDQSSAPDLYALPIMPLILIVVEDIDEQQLIAKNLESQNFRAVVSKSGQEGLRQAILLKPDLVLLEITLTDIKGSEVCRRLKSDIETESIPVIYMITYNEMQKLPDGFAAGGEDYLCKPIHTGELLLRIKLCLNLYGSRFKRKAKKSGWSWLGGQTNHMQTPHELPSVEQRLSVKFLSNTESMELSGVFSNEYSLLHELHVYRLKLEKQNEALREARITAEMALERYTALFDFAPTAYFILGRESLIYQTNFRGANLLNRERFKIIGQRFINYVISNDRALFKQFLENVFTAKHKQSLELCLRINEQNIWVNIDASIADSSLRTCLVDVTDISERKRIELEKQRLLDILEESADFIGSADLKGKLLYHNRAARCMVGLDESADLSGMTIADMHPAWAVEQLKEIGFPKLLQQGIWRSDSALLHRDGHEIPVALLLVLHRDGAGNPEFTSTIMQDITARKRMEAQLTRQAVELRTLVENSPDAIIRYDNQCRRIFTNPAYLSLSEAMTVDVIGKTPMEFWSMLSPSAEEYTQRLNTIINTGRLDVLEVQRMDNAGQIMYFATYLVPEFDNYGNVTTILSISRDITELKATERHLEESRTQLRALSAQREETREDERKRIAREMHDELGQRLTALRMDIARLRLRFGQDNPELVNQVKEMLLAVDATIQVVRDVAAALRPAVLDMGIVYALEWLVEDFCKRSGIQCDLHIPESKNFALDDSHSTAIFRIVQESLTNVAKHSEATKVTVKLVRLESDYLLEITDNGKGFDPYAAHKLGSFGLIGIEERVLMLGGKLTVNTSPGKGVQLCVLFSIQFLGIQT